MAETVIEVDLVMPVLGLQPPEGVSGRKMIVDCPAFRVEVEFADCFPYADIVRIGIIRTSGDIVEVTPYPRKHILFRQQAECGNGGGVEIEIEHDGPERSFGLCAPLRRRAR